MTEPEWIDTITHLALLASNVVLLWQCITFARRINRLERVLLATVVVIENQVALTEKMTRGPSLKVVRDGE